MTTALDLSRERDLGELIGDAVGLFREHAAVFLSLTLSVLAPVVILVDGVWGRALRDGSDAHAPAGAQLVSILLAGLVLPTIVTALHVRVVEGLGRGEEPTVGRAFRAAAPVFWPAICVVALTVLGVLLGFLALIVPGVWLGVRWYFGAQVVVIEGRRGKAALDRSAELVRDRWWRVFGVLLATGLLFGIISAVISSVLAAGGALLYVVGLILGQSLALSLTALTGTLLFFDLRARTGEPWGGERPVATTAP